MEFSSLVPLMPKHYGVTSPKLADLSSSAGNWIETIFKRMREASWPFPEPSIRFPRRITSVDQFRDTFEKPYLLSKQRVFVKRYFTEYHRVIRPFAAFAKGENPDWFRDYSKLKHDRVKLQAAMTLKKATEALAGLFLLNVYPHEMREYLLELDVIHGETPHGKGRAIAETLMSHPNLLQGRLLSMARFIYAETPLFKFEFRRARAASDLRVMPSSLYYDWKMHKHQESYP